MSASRWPRIVNKSDFLGQCAFPSSTQHTLDPTSHAHTEAFSIPLSLVTQSHAMTDLRELGVADTEDLGDHGGVGVTETSSTAPVDLGLAASGPSRLSFSPPPLPLDEEDELPPGAPSSDPWTADDLAAIAAAEAAERQRLSFERSLAGPSVGKAGKLRRDEG